jgi:S1-C subfamily serine protease
MTRLFPTLLLTVAFLLSPLGYQRVAQSERALQAVSENNPELHTICSGSTIGDGYHVLTAAHCTTGQVFVGGEPAKVVYRDEAIDLAVLLVKSYAKPLKMQNEAPGIGQAISIIGHPLGLPTQYFRGYISSLDTVLDGQHYTLYDATACGGNSGSGVTSDNDELVGVLQIGFSGPFGGCSGFSGGAPWAVVARVVGKYGRA